MNRLVIAQYKTTHLTRGAIVGFDRLAKQHTNERPRKKAQMRATCINGNEGVISVEVE